MTSALKPDEGSGDAEIFLRSLCGRDPADRHRPGPSRRLRSSRGTSGAGRCPRSRPPSLPTPDRTAPGASSSLRYAQGARRRPAHEGDRYGLPAAGAPRRLGRTRPSPGRLPQAWPATPPAAPLGALFPPAAPPAAEPPRRDAAAQEAAGRLGGVPRRAWGAAVIKCRGGAVGAGGTAVAVAGGRPNAAQENGGCGGVGRERLLPLLLVAAGS